MDVHVFLDAVVKQDAKKLRRFFAKDAHISWPNTNEMFTANEYVRAICKCPKKSHGYVEDIKYNSNGVFFEQKLWDDNGHASGVTSFVTFVAGGSELIQLLVEYRSDIRESPERRKTIRNNEIVMLDRDRWKGYILPFHYVSNNFYDVEITREADDFHVSFVKKPFDVPYEKMPDDSDKLFRPWWDDIKAWGIIDGVRLTAAIETAAEKWSNRLRVTELWIDDASRRQGIGTILMNIAMRRAKEEHRRALMLETQACNEGALAFYLAYGFTLIGFNACDYHNDDLRRGEVRMEMGILLD